jgi:hypothetical protein
VICITIQPSLSTGFCYILYTALDDLVPTSRRSSAAKQRFQLIASFLANPQPTVNYGFWMPFLIADTPKKNEKKCAAGLNRGRREIGMPGMRVVD